MKSECVNTIIIFGLDHSCQVILCDAEGNALDEEMVETNNGSNITFDDEQSGLNT